MKFDKFKEAVQTGGTFTNMLGQAVEVRFKVGYQVGTSSEYLTDIEKAYETFYKAVIESGALFIGIWEEDGKIFIEESKFIRNRMKAIELGKELNQLAIYNWEEDKVEWL